MQTKNIIFVKVSLLKQIIIIFVKQITNQNLLFYEKENIFPFPG